MGKGYCKIEAVIDFTGLNVLGGARIPVDVFNTADGETILCPYSWSISALTLKMQECFIMADSLSSHTKGISQLANTSSTVALAGNMHCSFVSTF